MKYTIMADYSDVDAIKLSLVGHGKVDTIERINDIVCYVHIECSEHYLKETVEGYDAQLLAEM